MYKNLKIFFIILFPLMFCACNSGTDPFKVSYVDYKIKIDKVIVPNDSINTKTIKLLFEGFVGINGCFSFKEFEVSIYGNEIDIIVWGQRAVNAGCPESEKHLNSEELKINVSNSGQYFIRVHQPDESILLKKIFVK